MQNNLQQKIDELTDLLKKERLNMQGDVAMIQKQLQNEISELKK
jgi:hypothetical protein